MPLFRKGILRILSHVFSSLVCRLLALGSVALHRLNNSVGTFLRQVIVHHEQGVYHAGYPTQQGQEQIEQRLDRLGAEEYRQRGQYDGKEISHILGSVVIKPSN